MAFVGYESIQFLLKTKQEEKRAKDKSRTVKNYFDDSKFYKDYTFIGFDGESNSYWLTSRPNKPIFIIVIYSSDGEILYCFETDYSDKLRYAVDSEGNLYTMTSDFKKGLTIWQFPRKW